MSKETLQIKAYNWIIKEIIGKNLPPGFQLREEHIAEELNMSATPVREALRRLEREGWVENVPFKGCVLKTFTEDEIRELHQLRAGMETAVIPEVIKNMTPADYQELRGMLKDQELLLEKFRDNSITFEEFHKEFIIRDTEFHAAMIRTSHRKRMIELAGTWDMQLSKYSARSISSEKYDHQLELASYTIDQHRAILTAIRLKWTAAARELVSAHILSALDSLFEGTFADFELDTPTETDETKKKNKSCQK